MKKRVLSLALVVLMLLSLIPVSAMADGAASGTYTDDNGVTYTLESGVLTVSGTGECSSLWKDNFDITAVTEVIIENSVTSIGDWAFEFCSGLTSISIPDSVTSIGYHAFSDCCSLTEINVSPENPSYSSIDAVLYSKEKTELIQCPGGKSGSISIPDGVTSIGDSSFSSCSELTSITIPNSVTSIGDWAFGFCSGLTSISIPDSVVSIGHDAFGFCSGLTSISIPDGVTSVANGAFNGCSGLASISIPDSVTSIGCDAFYGCSALTSITIPNGVTSIGASAFCFCSGLASISIPDGVTSIGDWTFGSCSGLTSISIPNGVTSIGEYAFCECSALKSITIPDSVTSIGEYAFNGCRSLADVYYSGTKKQWKAISIEKHNACLTGATRHYNSKQETTHTHDTELRNVKSATCTEVGYTGDEVCKTCGEIVKVGAEITVLGHDYMNGVCTRCGAADPDYKEPTPAVSFTDVSETAYYAKPVAWAVANNITGGYNDNTFRPMNICTRAQIVTFIWRANGSPEPLGTAKGFNDVAEGTYYYKAVLWAAENGITGGFDDGGFHPDELVTRAQAMTFLWRANDCPTVPAGTANTFKDVPEAAYYRDAVLWAVANNITGGYDASTFGSMDGCTRAQIVTFLYRDMA